MIARAAEQDGWLPQATWDFVGLVMNMTHRIDVQGLHHYSRSGPTLAIANHRFDSDGPIIASLLLGSPRLSGRRTIPRVIAREDMFRAGFLADYLEGWPEPIRSLAGRINFERLFRRLCIQPMHRVPERSIGEVLDDVRKNLGDLPLEEVLRPAWVERFQTGVPGQTLRVSDTGARQFRALLRERHAYRKLRRDRFIALKEIQRGRIDEQLAQAAQVLTRGGVVQLKPEGVTPVDGNIARFRAALYELVRRADLPVRLLPIGIVYDFMTTGRRHVFVRVGPELVGLQGLARRELNRVARKAILAQLTITTTQLASACLYRRDPDDLAVERLSLARHLTDESARLQAAGAPLDPRLLSGAGRAERLAAFLDFCMHKAILLKSGNGSLRINPSALGPPSFLTPSGLLGYASNELDSFVTGYQTGITGWPNAVSAFNGGDESLNRV